MFNLDGLFEPIFTYFLVALIVVVGVTLWICSTQDIITDKPLQPNEVIIKTINGDSDTTYRYNRLLLNVLQF